MISSDLIGIIVSQGVVSLAVVYAIVRWGADRMATRLEQSWQHENERHLETLRGEMLLRRDLVTSGSSTVTAAYLVAQERRLDAVEALWEAVLNAREQHVGFVSTIDMLPGIAMEKQRLGDLFPATDLNSAVMIVHQRTTELDKVERYRPFLSSELWVLFHVYRAFGNHVLLGLVTSFEEDDKLKSVSEIITASEGGPQSLLRDVLSEQEITQAASMPIMQFRWLTNLLEQKILTAMGEHMTGAVGSDLSFAEATRVAQKLGEADDVLRVAPGGG